MLRRAALLVMVLAVGCSRGERPPIEDVSGSEDLSRFRIERLRGTRDGERLDVEATFGDGGSASEVLVELEFKVGTPSTNLSSGRWRRGEQSGAVRQRAVMFLGGQSGPPSIGGRFDLLDASGAERYRIAIPTTELDEPLRR